MSATIRLRVTPRSSRSEIAGYADGVLAVRVTAPPAEGQANKAVVQVLARALGCPKSAISIKSGASGRHKTVEIADSTQNEIEDCLRSFSTPA